MKLNCEYIINGILIAIIILLVVNLCMKRMDNLKDTKPIDSSLKSRIKDANLVIYKSNNCGYCKQLVQDLDKKKLLPAVTLKDITNPVHKQEFKNLNETGVPVVYSQKYDKKHVGYADINTIVSSMNI